MMDGRGASGCDGGWRGWVVVIWWKGWVVVMWWRGG